MGSGHRDYYALHVPRPRRSCIHTFSCIPTGGNIVQVHQQPVSHLSASLALQGTCHVPANANNTISNPSARTSGLALCCNVFSSSIFCEHGNGQLHGYNKCMVLLLTHRPTAVQARQAAQTSLRRLHKLHSPSIYTPGKQAQSKNSTAKASKHAKLPSIPIVPVQAQAISFTYPSFTRSASAAWLPLCKQACVCGCTHCSSCPH